MSVIEDPNLYQISLFCDAMQACRSVHLLPKRIGNYRTGPSEMGSTSNSNNWPPALKRSLPAPSGRPKVGKKTAPSVDSPGFSLVSTNAIAEAAAAAFNFVEATSARAERRRCSYPFVERKRTVPYSPIS